MALVYREPVASEHESQTQLKVPRKIAVGIPRVTVAHAKCRGRGGDHQARCRVALRRHAGELRAVEEIESLEVEVQLARGVVAADREDFADAGILAVDARQI